MGLLRVQRSRNQGIGRHSGKRVCHRYCHPCRTKLIRRLLGWSFTRSCLLRRGKSHRRRKPRWRGREEPKMASFCSRTISQKILAIRKWHSQLTVGSTYALLGMMQSLRSPRNIWRVFLRIPLLTIVIRSTKMRSWWGPGWLKKLNRRLKILRIRSRTRVTFPTSIGIKRWIRLVSVRQATPLTPLRSLAFLGVIINGTRRSISTHSIALLAPLIIIRTCRIMRS